MRIWYEDFKSDVRPLTVNKYCLSAIIVGLASTAYLRASDQGFSKKKLDCTQFGKGGISAESLESEVRSFPFLYLN